MKLLTMLFTLILTLPVFANEQETSINQESAQPTWQYKCECNAIDMDHRSYYGWSRNTLSQAIDRAMTSCYQQTQSPGTCEINKHDRCSCD